jgi:hypothetical protein
MDLARWIRPGDGVVFGQACAEPQTLVEALVAQRAAYPGTTLFMGVNWSGIVKPEHADHLRLAAYCGSGRNRALADAGVLEIHPHPYSQLGALIRARRIRADVIFRCSPSLLARRPPCPTARRAIWKRRSRATPRPSCRKAPRSKRDLAPSPMPCSACWASASTWRSTRVPWATAPSS